MRHSRVETWHQPGRDPRPNKKKKKILWKREITYAARRHPPSRPARLLLPPPLAYRLKCDDPQSGIYVGGLYEQLDKLAAAGATSRYLSIASVRRSFVHEALYWRRTAAWSREQAQNHVLFHVNYKLIVAASILLSTIAAEEHSNWCCLQFVF
jgi:hypothetical protein